MKTYYYFTILLLGIVNLTFAQDKVIKVNNEEVIGKIVRFENGKFTLILTDMTELTFHKDGVKAISFDTSACINEGKGIVHDNDMTPDCDLKKTGNCIFINNTKTGFTLFIERNEKIINTYTVSKDSDPVKIYDMEAGAYTWRTTNGFYTSGGLFIIKCQTAKPITIK